MERVFCIYCKKTIDININETQICSNCSEILKIPHAELFNGVYVLKNEVLELLELQELIGEKILFKGFHELTANEFDVNEDHSIISLKINFNNLTKLPSLFNEFSNLVELKIVSRSLLEITEQFKPPKIESLSFFSSEFRQFPKAILNCSTLLHLWISGSKIKVIPKEIEKLQRLQSLKLNNNKIATLDPQIKSLLNLSIVDLGCNQLQEFPEGLLHLPNLSILKLHVNYIETIPSGLDQLKNLQILEVYCNHLIKLPKLPSGLEYLDISSNFNLELSDDFSEFSNLKLLNMAGTKKVNLDELKKTLKETALVTKLNPLAPNAYFLK